MTALANKPKKVAIVVHQEHSRPGRVGALLEKRGYKLHRLCPNLGCELPEDMSDYAGVVIFGGPMSANDCGTLAGIKCFYDEIMGARTSMEKDGGGKYLRAASGDVGGPA